MGIFNILFSNLNHLLKKCFTLGVRAYEKKVFIKRKRIYLNHPCLELENLDIERREAEKSLKEECINFVVIK